jgi:hypothetical protein
MEPGAFLTDGFRGLGWVRGSAGSAADAAGSVERSYEAT